MNVNYCKNQKVVDLSKKDLYSHVNLNKEKESCSPEGKEASVELKELKTNGKPCGFNEKLDDSISCATLSSAFNFFLGVIMLVIVTAIAFVALHSIRNVFDVTNNKINSHIKSILEIPDEMETGYYNTVDTGDYKDTDNTSTITSNVDVDYSDDVSDSVSVDNNINIEGNNNNVQVNVYVGQK